MSLSACNLSVLGRCCMFMPPPYQYLPYQISSQKLLDVMLGHISISIDVPRLDARMPASSGWTKSIIDT